MAAVEATRSFASAQIPAAIENSDAPSPENSSSEHHVERLRIAAGILAQYDQQNAVEVHSVFRVNGKAVGVVARNGQIIFDTAGDFRLAGGLRPYDEAGERGFVGDAYMDYMATRIAENLARKFSDALRVEHFAVGSGPTMGELRGEMFGLTRERLWSMAIESAYKSQSAELFDGIVIFPKM